MDQKRSVGTESGKGSKPVKADWKEPKLIQLTVEQTGTGGLENPDGAGTQSS